MKEKLTLVETTRISNTRSLRMSLSRRVALRMDVGRGNIVGFFESEKGEIVLRRLR